MTKRKRIKGSKGTNAERVNSQREGGEEMRNRERKSERQRVWE